MSDSTEEGARREGAGRGRRTRKLLTIGAILVIPLGAATVSLVLTLMAVDPVDLRTGAVWTLYNGRKVTIEQSYFTVEGVVGTFNVEWDCPTCDRAVFEDLDAAMRVVRPVLRHAVVTGELGRTDLRNEAGEKVAIQRLRAVIGVPGSIGAAEVLVTDFSQLMMWDLGEGEQSFRIVGTMNSEGPEEGRMFLSRWAPKTGCATLFGLEGKERTASAREMAMPLLRLMAADELWRSVPFVSAEGMSAPLEQVDWVGVVIECAHESCKPGNDCPVLQFAVGERYADLIRPGMR
ncbi:MAG: hypothetical protein R3B72_24640 [Polyangiaceae bacterium]